MIIVNTFTCTKKVYQKECTPIEILQCTSVNTMITISTVFNILHKASVVWYGIVMDKELCFNFAENCVKFLPKPYKFYNFDRNILNLDFRQILSVFYVSH